jgi:deoxyribonuclease-4
MPSMNLGAHMSTAGGLHLAFARGAATGCNTMQVFSKNERQWQAKPLTPEAIEQFKDEAARSHIKPLLTHASYLINIATAKDDLWERSIAALSDELERANLLGIPYVVLHPGAHTGAGTESGIARVAAALDRLSTEGIGGDTKVLLETTAGQGTTLGGSFEELTRILDQLHALERIEICVDTCHIFAAGYDISTDEGYTAAIARLIELVGLSRIAAFHLNDSKGACGSHLDRHEAIGEGQIGLTGFRNVVNDPRFCSVPMILETPKGTDDTEDIRNLQTLRGLRAAVVTAEPQGEVASLGESAKELLPKP